jgi:hypothetical protein
LPYAKARYEFRLGREGVLVLHHGFLSEDIQTHAFDAADGAGEVLLD